MRILYLNPNGTVGGAETSLLHLMAVLRATQPQWKLCLITGAEGPLLSRAEALDVPARAVPFPRSLRRLGDAGLFAPNIFRLMFLMNLLSGGVEAPAYVKRLRQAVREFRPDLVHSNGFKMHLLSICAPNSRVPVVWHLHDYVRSRPLTAPLLRLCAFRCSAAITNSTSVAEDLRSVCASKLNIESVPNGIDTEAFTPDGPCLDLDRLSGLPPHDPNMVRIGMLGTFARWKGHEVFLRALAQLDPRVSFRAYVVGGPIYQTNGSQHTLAHLENLSGNLGLSGRIGFTGFIDDPARALRSLDIVVHASTEPEPFGMVIVEAMACGKAVIVSKSGGTLEIVQDGVNALTHAPGDIVALAALIRKLAENPELRAQLGKAARLKAERCFSRLRFGSEFSRIYQRLAGTQN